MLPSIDPPAREAARHASPPAHGASESHGGDHAPVVSGASNRLRALAALSGSLTDALEPEEASHLVQAKALTALGATSAVVVTLGSFPPAPTDAAAARETPVLRLVHAIGLDRALAEASPAVPLDPDGPLAEVSRVGAPIFLADEAAMRRYPVWGSASIAHGARSAAIVPVWANGELRGVLGLTWAIPHEFDEDERAFVVTLGAMCAQAIMRAHLREAELAARESAERANRSKSDFLTMIGHELRTPMNAMMGYSDLLASGASGAVSDLQVEQLGRIGASGRHLMGLVEELLAFARADAGMDTITPEPLVLEDVVQECVQLIHPLAERKGLRIRVQPAESPIEMYTDRLKLRQILVNLVANAVKFTAAGSVAIELRVGTVDRGVTVFIEVTDSGRGIPPEDHDRVFEAYWRSPNLATLPEAGTGLGLPLARKLARMLGGDVRLARSEPDLGSTFVVTLPPRYEGTAGIPVAS